VIRSRLRTALLVAVLVPAGPAAAQFRPDHVPAADTAYRPRILWSIVGSTLGGTVGFFAGALTGAVVGGDCQGDFCIIGHMFLGALVGETLGFGLGAHWGNGGRGNVLLPLVAGAAVSAIGLALILPDGDLGGLTIGLPLIEIPLAVVTELWSGRARAGRR
jgi:hypothetical protein